MAIISKLVAMLALDSVAFDAGMTKARNSTRAFGADIKKIGGEAVSPLVAVGLNMHAITGAVRVAADSVAAFSAASRGDWAAVDQTLRGLPAGIGGAYGAVRDLRAELDGTASAIRRLEDAWVSFADAAKGRQDFVQALTKMRTVASDLRGELAVLEAGVAGGDKSAALAQVFETARKRRDAITEAAKAPGGLGLEHPKTQQALQDVDKIRSLAARKIFDTAPKGEDEWNKVYMAHKKLTLSAEAYRRIELEALKIDKDRIAIIMDLEAVNRKIVEDIERQDLAIEAAYPDIDTTFFDEYLAGQKELAADADALTKSLRSPWQVLQDEVDNYTLLLEKGLITQETFNAAVTKAGQGAVDAAGGVSPHAGTAAIWTERRQYGALGGGGDTVPALLKQQLKEMAGTNRGVQKLLDSGGLG